MTTLNDIPKWGRLTPASEAKKPKAHEWQQIVTFFNETSFGAPVTLTGKEVETLRKTLNAVNQLFTDIGLRPDRDYTINEIVRLQWGREWALEGEK